jgi:8-oxo-dGTP diphosphatase
VSERPAHPAPVSWPDRFAVAVDCVLFGVGTKLQVLLIERRGEPFAGKWALPGGFLRQGETLEQAVGRELAEEAGVLPAQLLQLQTLSALERDPRERVLSVAFLGLVRPEDHAPHAASDAQDARWFALGELPALAFDHQRIVEMGRIRLQSLVRHEGLGFELLPRCFTLAQLQNFIETILGETQDKRNFRRKALASGALLEDGKQANVAHRAARLYRFDWNKIRAGGVDFNLGSG